MIYCDGNLPSRSIVLRLVVTLSEEDTIHDCSQLSYTKRHDMMYVSFLATSVVVQSGTLHKPMPGVDLS